MSIIKSLQIVTDCKDLDERKEAPWILENVDGTYKYCKAH